MLNHYLAQQAIDDRLRLARERQASLQLGDGRQLPRPRVLRLLPSRRHARPAAAPSIQKDLHASSSD
jgi:hypothetical protein